MNNTENKKYTDIVSEETVGEIKLNDDSEALSENGEEHSHRHSHHSHSHSHSHGHSGEHHHHSSHHHSSHHHKKKHKKRNKNSVKKPKIDSRTVVKIIVLMVVFSLIAALLGVVYYYEKNYIKHESDGEPENEVVLDGSFAIEPFFTSSAVDIIDPVAKKCLEIGGGVGIMDALKNYGHNKGTFDRSVPVTFKHTMHNVPDGTTIEGYIVEISENSDMSDSRSYKFGANENIEIEYLKTNTKYYYKVTATPAGFGYIGELQTSDTPRILTVDGIGNVRDIGNWKAEGGTRIKQGLLYRGTELEGIVKPDYKLTEKGKEILLKELGIKFEMDLRGEYDNPTNIDILGDSVEHKYYDCNHYKAVFTDNGKEKIKKIFTDLAEPANYPIYLHCTYGLDRTGTVCYLLEGLLGVSDEDLEKDYQLSALFHFSYNEELFETMVLALQEYEGETTSEKIESYLLSCGITHEQIESIRNIFLEG